MMPLWMQPAARYHYERWRGLLERELPIFCSQIKPQDVVVDVGANVGIYVHALRRCGAIVEAFEPQPECSAVLEAYAAAYPSVHVHTLALGDAESVVTLSVPIENGRLARTSATTRATSAGAGETIRVPVRTLDSFELGRVNAMKIDVEGAELDVLRGAVRTIERARPLLLVEIEQRHHAGSIQAVFDCVTELGYEGTFLLPSRGLRPLSEFSAREHQRLDSDGQPTGVYVNNFIFRPTVPPPVARSQGVVDKGASA
jgi:FkbM family methyltransferase